MASAGSGLTNFLQQSAVPPLPSGNSTGSAGPLWLQDYLFNVLGAASNLAQQPFTPFPGPQVAAPSDQTKQAWNLAGQNVGQYKPDLTAANSLISGATAPISAADVQSFLNPYQSYITGALNQNLQENLLPSIQDKFVGAGQSRSPQEAEITSRALRDTDTSIGEALAQNYQGAMNSLLQQRGQQITGGSALGQLGALGSELGIADVGQLAGAGQQQNQIAQANIDAALNNFQQQQFWPYQQVGFLSDVARGLPVSAAGNQGQTINAGYPGAFAYGTSPLQQLAGQVTANNSGSGSFLGPFRRGGPVRGFAEGGRSIQPFKWPDLSPVPTPWTVEDARRAMALKTEGGGLGIDPFAFVKSHPAFSATPLKSPYAHGGRVGALTHFARAA